MVLEVGQMLQGQVVQFDQHVGLGAISVADAQYGESLPFHCVSIADGSRNIDIGVQVSFKVAWHPRGRFEAVDISLIRVTSN